MYFFLNDIWLKKIYLSFFEIKDVYEIMEEILFFY